MTQATNPRRLGNRRGALAMSAAMTLLIINDTMTKLASETLPPSQTIAIRGIFCTLWVLLAVLATGHARYLPQALERRTLIRAALDVAGTISYLYALFQLPLAEATTINMAAPLLMVMLAVVYLREAVHWQRWLAVIIGFAGVLLVVRPGGANFTWWAVLCLGATALNAARDVYTRTIASRVPSLIITITGCAVTALITVAITTVQGWQPVSAHEYALLISAAFVLAFAYYLMIVAMRHGEVSVVGAFRYSGLPAAALLGWLVWGHVPDALTFAGMAILVAAGFYILNQGRRA